MNILKLSYKCNILTSITVVAMSCGLTLNEFRSSTQCFVTDFESMSWDGLANTIISVEVIIYIHVQNILGIY